jgi:hypothetical protein
MLSLLDRRINSHGHARPDLYFFTCLPSHLGMATFSMEVFDNEVVPSTLSSIAPILR